MIRGTTPLHTFTLPFSTELCNTVRVIYGQNGQPVLVKSGSDLRLDGNNIELKLTQEDTLKLCGGMYVDIQVRVLTHGGDALASDVVKVPVGRCLENEVI